jgi:hypothetical protein
MNERSVPFTKTGCSRYQLATGPRIAIALGVSGLLMGAFPAEQAMGIVLFSDDFSTATGWSGYETDYWERGPATAGGGTVNGNPDPGTDHSPGADNYLIGVNIGGDFSTAANGPHYLTSPVIDCSGYTTVEVSFYRWLNCWGASASDHFVEVYDGSVWHRIFLSEFTEDNSWEFRRYDVSKYAANNANFRVRFLFEYITTSFPEPYSGWNVDDFEVATFVGDPNEFVDPDFEAESSAWVLSSAGSSLGGYLHHAAGWYSSGDSALYLYTFNNQSITAGAYRGYQQDVDLTNVDTIVFDAYFENGTHVDQQVLIDGSVVWSKSAPGTYLDQTIDVSAYSGVHTVQFELYVATSGTSVPSEHLDFDNIRTTSSGGSVCCPTTISSLPYTEGFESGLGDWINASGDDFDWTQQTGGTGSTGTGPSSAHGGSYYLYTEASSPNYPNKAAILEGPCFDLGTAACNPKLTFWYHMYGAAMGTLRVEVSDDDCASWVSIWSLSGDQGDVWQEATVTLAPYDGNTIKLRFVGETGSSFTSDMAIDDVTVTAGEFVWADFDQDCDVDLADYGKFLDCYNGPNRPPACE